MLRTFIATTACVMAAGCAGGPQRQPAYSGLLELAPEPSFDVSYSGEIKPGRTLALGGMTNPNREGEALPVLVEAQTSSE